MIEISYTSASMKPIWGGQVVSIEAVATHSKNGYNNEYPVTITRDPYTGELRGVSATIPVEEAQNEETLTAEAIAEMVEDHLND